MPSRSLGDTLYFASQDRHSALLPLVHDASLWHAPCAGPCWALLGDAAGHVHPLIGLPHTQGRLRELETSPPSAEARDRW